MSVILPFQRPECAGTGCKQGRAPQACDCRPRQVPHLDLHRITFTELDNEIAPCPNRTFRPAAVHDRPRIHLRTVAIAAAALIAFGLLLWCFPRAAESRTLVVLVGQPR